MTRIDPTKMEAAKEWAKRIHSAHHPDSVAAAEVIASLPDTIVDGDKVRELIEEWRTDCPDAEGRMILEQVEALLPAPAPRTLADMTPEERAACRWMQADYDGERVVLTKVTDAVVSYLWPSGTPGTRSSYYRDMFTPLPDLPRMVWPEEQDLVTTSEAVDDLAHAIRLTVEYVGNDMLPPVEGWSWFDALEKYRPDLLEGFIDKPVGGPASEQAAEETPDPPRPEDVPEPQPGEAWLIEYEGGYYDAVYWYSPIYAHWSFVVSREGLKSIESGEAKALRRLVTDGEDRHE